MFAGGVSHSHVPSSVTIRTAVGSENYYGHKFIVKLRTGCAVLSQTIKYCTLTQIVLLYVNTWSVRKVSDRIFLCEHLMDYNLARFHEPTLNLSAHA